MKSPLINFENLYEKLIPLIRVVSIQFLGEVLFLKIGWGYCYYCYYYQRFCSSPRVIFEWIKTFNNSGIYPLSSGDFSIGSKNWSLYLHYSWCFN